MIIVPEIETIVLLVPRNASGAIYRATLEKYPKAMMLYRHMEASGVPAFYDRWAKVGVVRNPVDRLWSFYKFMRQISRSEKARLYPDWGAKVLRIADRPFEDWLINNEGVFSAGYDGDYASPFFPLYAVQHQIPENRKSQFLTLRPDLGTTVYRYSDLGAFAARINIVLGRSNETDDDPTPSLSEEAWEYLARHFAWDFGAA